MKRFLVRDTQDGNRVVYEYRAEAEIARDADDPLFPSPRFVAEEVPLQEHETAETTPAPVYNGRRILTRLEFVRMFPVEERVAVFNYDVAPLPDQYKAIIRTLLEQMKIAEEINLDDPDIVYSVNLLETLGIVTPGRAAEVLRG